MSRYLLRALFAALFLLVLFSGHSWADLCGIDPEIADIKVGSNYCDTIEAGFEEAAAVFED